MTPGRTDVTIRAACSPGEVRVAALAAGELQDYAIWRPGVPDGVGDLHRGRVATRARALGGAFVALADADGFLPDTEGGATAREGDAVLVRVTRAAQGGKGPRLSARIGDAADLLPVRGPPVLLRRGPGAVERLAAAYPAAPVLVDDPAIAAALRPRLADRLRLVARAFDDAIEAAIADLAAPVASLPGGMRLAIHPTPALVAIDVDLGGAAASSAGRTAAHLAANEAALPFIARAIRLRNLSGAILLDFAGLGQKRRPALGPRLVRALAADPLRPRLLGFTALGLAEIVRTRIHPPLHELLGGAHAAGLAGLRRLAAEAAAAPGRPLALRASPAVAAALQDDEAARDAVLRCTGRPLKLQADPGLCGDWMIEEMSHG